MKQFAFALTTFLFWSTAAQADTANLIYFCNAGDLYVKVIHVANDGAVKINEAQYVRAFNDCQTLAEKLNSK